MKKLLFLVLSIGLGYAAFQNLDSNLLSSSPATNLYTLIPKDAACIVEIEDPIDKWENFSEGNIWQHLSKNPYLKEVTTGVESFKATLSGKEGVLKFLLHDKMLASAHVTGLNKYDYLYTVNIKSIDLLTKIPQLLPQAFKAAGYSVNTNTYGSSTIYQLTNPEDKSILYVSTENDAVVASFNKKLLQKALGMATSPYFTKNQSFNTVQQQIDGRGLSNAFVHYDFIDKLVACYANPTPNAVQALRNVFSFSGLNVNIKNNYIELDGRSLVDEQVPKHIKPLLNVQAAPVKAHRVLPNNTAFFTSLCFDEFDKLRAGIMQLKQQGKKAKGLQGMVQAELEKELPKWIENEITLAMIPKANNSSGQSYVVVIPTGKQQGAVAKKLQRLTGTIESVLPINLFAKDKSYKGYRLIRIPVEGLLKKLAGDFLADVQKPFMILMDEFLVFSDDEAIIKSMIDQYKGGKTLINNSDYKRFYSNFKDNTNVFTYVQMQHFYPYLLQQTASAKKQTIRDNKNYFLSFPHTGFQLSPNNKQYETYIYSAFKAVNPKRRGGK